MKHTEDNKTPGQGVLFRIISGGCRAVRHRKHRHCRDAGQKHFFVTSAGKRPMKGGMQRLSNMLAP
jgi:hypothetical protein